MAKKKKKKSGSRRMEMLVVGSKAKAALKKNKCNVAGDALDGLNNVLHWYIDQAATRAKANGRKTVRAHDFVAM
jgi:histone H3/H4